MSEEAPDAEPDFPSGEWTGFYQQGDRKHGQELVLTFAHGRMHGDGIDDIGRFGVRGSYDRETREVWWTKTYSTHDVHYRGFREIKGIWGTWEIGSSDRGGFHIWPRWEGEAHAERASAEVEEPLEAVAPDGVAPGDGLP